MIEEGERGGERGGGEDCQGEKGKEGGKKLK